MLWLLCAQVDPGLMPWVVPSGFKIAALAYVDGLGRAGRLDELQHMLMAVRKRFRVLKTSPEVALPSCTKIKISRLSG